MKAFIQQKTTIAGIATILTTLSALLQGQINIHGAATAIIFALVLIVMPEEKTISQSDIAGLVGLAANAFALAKQAETPASKPAITPEAKP